MDQYTAVGLAEGFVEPSSSDPEEAEAEVLAAWQYLIDTGLVWRLQGWFGRVAQGLIKAGLCRPIGDIREDVSNG